jgi:hypothetical protein
MRWREEGLNHVFVLLWTQRDTAFAVLFEVLADELHGEVKI